MKHKLVVLASILAIVVSTVLCVRAYDRYQVHARADAAIKHSQQAAENYKHEQLQKAAVAAEKKRLTDECAKETAYYNNLTPAQKAKLAAPTCANLPIVE
jgi:hypothetical protein